MFCQRELECSPVYQLEDLYPGYKLEGKTSKVKIPKKGYCDMVDIDSQNY